MAETKFFGMGPMQQVYTAAVLTYVRAQIIGGVGAVFGFSPDINQANSPNGSFNVGGPQPGGGCAFWMMPGQSLWVGLQAGFVPFGVPNSSFVFCPVGVSCPK